MKKLILAAFVAVVGIGEMSAQANMEALQIGARAGYNHANLRGDTPEGMNTQALGGFHLGLFVELPVAPRVSIQPEVLYSTQGAKLEGSVAGVSTETTIRSQYINVPVLAKIYVVEGLNLQVGPQIGFLTGGEITGRVGGVESTSDVTDSMNSIDFGAVVGAGYKVANNITIDARYNFGLSNVMDDSSNQNISAGNDWKNGVFSVGVGYQF